MKDSNRLIAHMPFDKKKFFLNKLILLLWLHIGVISHLPLYYLNFIQVNMILQPESNDS